MSPRLFFAIPGDIDLPTGGYGYDRHLITELTALGGKVEHIALPGTFPRPAEGDLQTVDGIFRALDDDALVLVDGLALGAMPDVARRHSGRLRLIALVHHPLALESGLDAQTAAHLLQSERNVLRGVRAVITTSRATALSIARDYGVPPEMIETAEPGTAHFGVAPVAGDPPLVLSLATLIPRKGHDALLRALSECHDLAWSARFVGSPELDPVWATELRRLAEAHNLAGRVAFLGSTEDPGAEMLGADIFALPSRHEGYGMAFAEALSCGLPIVGYAAGAVPDLVPPDAGILVPTDDEAALADALARIIRDPDLRARKAAGARAAGARLPRWPDTAKIVARVLDRVAQS